MKKLIALFATVAMVVATATTSLALQPEPTEQSEFTYEASDDFEIIREDRIKGEKEGYWIVTLIDPALATYQGGIDGMAATSPLRTGQPKIDTGSAASREYTAYLEGEQDALIDEMSAAFGRSMDVTHRYTNAINGVTVWLTPSEASQVLRMSGVADVEKNKYRKLATDLGPAFIGSPNIWDGSATGVATQGEGIVVGIIDSGINPENPSFAATGDDGYTHTNPYGSGNFVGACDPTNAVQFQPGFTCNDKLIGAYDFFAADPQDSLDHDGHGSHTASTAAGNVVNNAGPAGETISGVAPHANIISYRTCGDESLGQGFCDTAGTVAAVNQAIADGVDVLNYSIGSESPGDPWADSDDQAFLAARVAGIFVAHSAGNEGPGSATVGSPAAPWVTHVAALTHDRPALNSLINMTGGDPGTPPPGDMDGRSVTDAEYTNVVVYAGDLPQYILDTGAVNNALCAVGDPDDGVSESPWPAGTFNGEIVVCDRGTYARVEKSENAAFSGAGGFIHADNGGGEVADPHVIPGIHIDQAEGNAVRAWVVAWDEVDPATQPTATITAAIPDPDSTASFSSRGHNRSTGGDTLMPTIGAPGVSIWAAHGKYGEITHTYLSGTSMASPHVAGAAALLKALNPSWTPAQIQSAMETTAKNDGLTKEDSVTAADPFDVGNGRVQVDVAANAGLLLDESQADYLDADPAAGGDPTAINNAHLANGQCLLQCSFVRTVTSSASSSVTWTVGVDFPGTVNVSVNPITLAPGESADIQFDVDVTGLSTTRYHFGEVTLTPSDSSIPEAHFAMAIRPQTGELPGQIDLLTRRDAGSDLVRGVTAIEIFEFHSTVDGLVKATQRTEDLPVDPTNGDPYDDSIGAFTEIVEIAPGSSRAIFEITASEAPDVDLYVGLDANGDGIATENELIALSASGTAFEKVVLDDPDGGSYWVLVQNWAGSGAETDEITLAYAVLDGTDAGNAHAEGPESQGALEPFDLRMFWDLEDAEEGDLFYGTVFLGTDPGNPGNIGEIPMTLRRLADDVTKTASVESAERGDTVDYEITVQPNVLSEDLGYTITDTLPDGMTYVDGSATATAGSVNVTDNVLTWTGVMASAFGVEGTYSVFTNAEEPEACAIPFADGGYLDLSGFGIGPDPGVTGDGVAFTAFSTSVLPFEYFDDATPGISFTDDGFAFFDSTPGPFSFAPNPIGTPHWASGLIEEPNDMLAPFWADMEIFFNAGAPGTERGVSLATLGNTSAVIEFDNMEPWDAGPDPVPGAPTLDFEIFANALIDDSPGAYEFAFAYDNIDGTFPASGFPFDLVIGLENEAGDAGTEVFSGLFTDPVPIADDLVICFDFQRPQFPPVTITYQATVDTDTLGGDLTNEAVSAVDNPGSEEDTVSAVVAVAELGDMEILALVRDAIADYPSTGDRAADRALDRAERYLDKALRDRYWADEDTLSGSGGAMFSWLALAALKVQYADARVGDDFSEWVDLMVGVARNQAEMAIAESEYPRIAQFWFNKAEQAHTAYWAITLYGVAFERAMSIPWWIWWL